MEVSTQEIIFIDRRRKGGIQDPPPLPDINRVSSIKILGVTVSDSLSTGWPKNGSFLVRLNFIKYEPNFKIISLSESGEKIPPHIKCVATLPCEMSSVLKATIENKTTSLTTHFKEINNREQRGYCLSYCLK